MGIIHGGVHGSMSGRVGNLVFYKLLGKDVVRMIGVCSKPASLKQLACRKELAVVVTFLKPFVSFINIGFLLEGLRLKKYPHNLAVSYNKLNALAGEYPDIVMDYSKVLVAQGRLRVAGAALVEVLPSVLRFRWDTGAWMEHADRNHMAMLLAYFPESGRALFCMNGTRRFEGEALLPLPGELSGELAHLYISFVELGSNEVADSVYVGSKWIE